MQQFRAEVCTLLVAVLLFFVPTASALETAYGPDAKWPRSRIVVFISSSLFNAPNINGDAGEVVRRSIAAWTKVADVRIDTVETDASSISPKGIRGDGVSLITAASTAENVRLFPKQADSPAAATRIFTDRRGNITEADIVLNPFVKFSTDGTFGTYDLQAAVTHEIGHLLGLDHSPAWGSVMFEKAGVGFGASMYAGGRESLPASDAAALRALYGPKADDADCCGVVMGRVTGIPLTAKESRIAVWIEEASTGRLVAAANVTDGGLFELGGVQEGSFDLRVAAEVGEGMTAFAEGSIQVTVADISRKNFKLTPIKTPFTADLVGTTPQIAKLPAILRPGGFHSLYVGGQGLDAGIARVRISGTDISVSSDEFRISSYGNSVKVIGFELASTVELAEGSYSLIIEDTNGVRRTLVGSLIVSR